MIPQIMQLCWRELWYYCL